MKALQEGVPQGILHGDPRLGRKLEHLGQEVERVFARRFREVVAQAPGGGRGQLQDEPPRLIFVVFGPHNITICTWKGGKRRTWGGKGEGKYLLELTCSPRCSGFAEVRILATLRLGTPRAGAHMHQEISQGTAPCP